jgi:biopolymer transport protein ExbD
MAGGGDVAAEPRKHGKAKKRKKGRRVGIRIDMTPLVDVAFLLLTFFMLTTSMSRPQTMEINLPPDQEAKVEIAESNLLTLRVNDKGTIYWSIGIESPKKIEFKDLRAFLKERASSNPKLVTLLKVDRLGKYNMMVNMMDELNLANITRFSLAPLLDADKTLMAKAQS